MSASEAQSATEEGQWRPALRRKLTVLLTIKLLALILLWALFFSPRHRVAVDETLMDEQFLLDATRHESETLQ